MDASERDPLAGASWLEHAAALRSLAAALTIPSGDADDLVQETWLRGLMFMGGPILPVGKQGGYGLTAPIGVVQLSCTLSGYVPYSESLDLRSAPKTLRIELVRGSGVRIEIFEGDARLRAGFGFFDGVRCTKVGERRPLGVPGGLNGEYELRNCSIRDATRSSSRSSKATSRSRPRPSRSSPGKCSTCRCG